MTRLIELRRRLASLRHRRQNVRWATAYSALVLAVLWALAAAFLADWLFEMTRVQRGIVLVICAGAVAWAFRRWSLPWLGRHESELDMALLVERQQRIDTDLIAAIEFESPEAPFWGSVELEQAVIDGTAVSSRRLNVMSALNTDELRRRAAMLGITVVVWALVTLVAPMHVLTFLNRAALGNWHYPTATQIKAVAINGHAVDVDDPAEGLVRVFFGQAARFEVTCQGDLPEDGNRIELRTLASGLRSAVELTPDEDRPGVYRGEWPRLIESVEYQVQVGTAWAEHWWLRPLGMFLGRRGKAWTEPGEIRVTQLPKIEVEPEVYAPSYATASPGVPFRIAPGLRQYSVIEGSRVVLRLTSDKLLKKATVTIDEQPYELRELKSEGLKDNRAHWVLDADDTPLAAVLAPVRYAVQVLDSDEQQLEKPIDGMVRLLVDNPPRIVAKSVTRYVLPTGKPTIYFGAADDYGLGSITVLREITHSDGQTEAGELPIYRIGPNERPQRNIESNVSLDLTPLKLVKGDTVKATLQAVDFRGKHPGKATSAEPLVFQVTDEQGILEGMREADRHSAEQLKAMIQRQLGIGGDSP